MRWTVSIPDKLSENLKRTAANRQVSVSSLVAEAVERYLIIEQRRALGNKAMELAGKVHVAPDADRMVEAWRGHDRS